MKCLIKAEALISYMRRLIKAKALEKWENHWKLAKKGHTYTQMKAIPH